jgi:ABC-type lipoprotein export system ATPase subunit
MTERLSMAGVCVSYGRHDRRVQVLRNVSLSVAAGEIVAVVGSGGAGRTTLLKVAKGLERPASGEVRFDGIDLLRLSDTKLTRLWGDRILWLDRESPLMSYKAYKHIAFQLMAANGMKAPDAERVAWEALEEMGVSGCGSRHWDTLSPWERLLVEFACAAAVRPQLILIDDLFDGLGSRRTHEAGQLLRSLADELDCGILVSVADPESALVADDAWCLSEGRLTHMFDELPAPPNIIALVAELHARGYKDAAAVVTGSTLEHHLRNLAVKCGVPTQRGDGAPQNSDALNNALASAGAYNRLQQKCITAWLDLRNKSVHGRYSAYDAAQVLAMIRDVRDFMTRFPA